MAPRDNTFRPLVEARYVGGLLSHHSNLLVDSGVRSCTPIIVIRIFGGGGCVLMSWFLTSG